MHGSATRLYGPNLVVAMLCVCCASMEERLHDAHHRSCVEMLHDHDSIIVDEDYSAVGRPTREEYEIEVAYCYLSDVRLSAPWL